MARRTATSAVQVQNASASLPPSESGSFVERDGLRIGVHIDARRPRARAPSARPAPSLPPSSTSRRPIPPRIRSGSTNRASSSHASPMRSSRATRPMTTPSSSRPGRALAQFARSAARSRLDGLQAGLGHRFVHRGPALELSSSRRSAIWAVRIVACGGRHRASHATARRAALLRRSRTSARPMARFRVLRRRGGCLSTRWRRARRPGAASRRARARRRSSWLWLCGLLGLDVVDQAGDVLRQQAADRAA